MILPSGQPPAPLFEEFEMIHSRQTLTRLAGLALRAAVRGALPVAIAAGAMLSVQSAAAQQQIKNVEPYFATVTKDNVPMKCADGGIFYAVSILKQGQVLRVDGEGPGWLRVEYLPGMKAYVKAVDATADSGGKSIKLARPSRLMAANVQGSRPWQFLLDSDLPAGTSFNVLEAVKGTDGSVEGYLVSAPTQSRGYVKNDQVRRSTAEETAAQTKPEPTRPEPTKPAAGDKPVVIAPPTPTPPASNPTPTPTPTPGTDVASTPAATPEGTTAAPVAAAPLTEAPRLKAIKDMDTLRTLFNSAMQRAGTEEEIKTVIGEFDRTTTSLGNTEEDDRTRQALAARKEALTLRLEVFEAGKKIRAAANNMNDQELKLRQLVDDVEKQAIYTIVGRIVPSTVYDGKRGMPLMYRIESADSSSSRTIGYVVPREGVDLLTVSGKVVGIVGESRMDEALRLNLVAARRVTVLNPAPAPRPIGPTPAEAEPSGPESATGENEEPGE